MPADALQQIREALKAGDKKTAQELLRPQLQYQPTAELWYLAAQACATDEKAIQCLRKALELQPQHSGANRMLHKLEGAIPKTVEVPPPLKLDAPTLEKLTEMPLKKVRRKKKRSTGRRLLLLGLLLLGMSCSLITMNMAGIITGPITLLTKILGGGAPVTQIGGKPISEVSDAPLEVEPSQIKPLENRDANVIEPGYAHEYTFEARRGWEMAIYVQFLSIAANKVSRNVVVLRPNNTDATPTCDRNAILQGDNNVTFTCLIDADGLWKVRILGRDHESVGAYFVGAERMGN